ncbi:hypothetical protein [Erythrobacter aurantius]|uniref:hypothetical protein n=1 Tax=Erythrobacter aurantius TaxID=2909249 RepID=UPI00207A263A|nr:hypothetical protein [Erythrobacter aurantius]
MSALVFFFAACFVITVFGAYAFMFVASFFVDGNAPRVAGFSYAIGNAGMANFFNDGGMTQVAALVGAISALTLVWYLFFKRVKAHG